MNFFRKILAGVYAYTRRQYNAYKQETLAQQFKHFGENSDIRYPITILGGEYISIGDDFFCGPDSRIEAWYYYKQAQQTFSPQILIGNDVKITGKCHIGAIQSIVIEDHVLMGSGVFITDHAHGDSSAEQIEIPPDNRPLYSKGPVKIESNVWLCEDVTVLPGVTIGRGSIVAAHAVVTKDIPPYSIAAGVPAKVVKTIR